MHTNHAAHSHAISSHGSGKTPNLFVELDSAVRIVNLAKGEADISVRMMKPTEIDVIPISSFEWGAAVFASKTYLKRYGYPKSVDELKTHRLIQYVETMLHLPLYNWIEEYAHKNSLSMRVENTEMAFGMIMQGGGIGVISCFYGDVSADVVRVFPEPVFSTTAWIVIHESDAAQCAFELSWTCLRHISLSVRLH